MISRFYIAAWIVVSTTFALPASAQRPSDAPVREAIEKFYAAFNSGDASVATDLWRADAIDISVGGMMTDKARRDETIANELKLGVKFEHKIDRVEVDDQIAWAAGSYTVTIPSKTGGSTQSSGYFVHILKQEGGAWKLQAVSFTRTNQPKKE
jgi:ketosteroid isomerase-like protein